MLSERVWHIVSSSVERSYSYTTSSNKSRYMGTTYVGKSATGVTLCSVTNPDSVYPKLTVGNACIGDVESFTLRTVLFRMINSAEAALWSGVLSIII